MQKSEKILAILLSFRRNGTKKTDSQEEIRLLDSILSMCLGFSEKRPDVFYDTCPCPSVYVSMSFGMCGD